MATPALQAILEPRSAADGQLSTLRGCPLDPTSSTIPEIRHGLDVVALTGVASTALVAGSPGPP